MLIASTPVGPIGSGVGGGVDLTLRSLTVGLGRLGHAVEVIAPSGSILRGEIVHQVEGSLQPSSQLTERDSPIELAAGSVLAAMWDRVADLHADADVVVNFAYDWLPFYLTRWLRTHLGAVGRISPEKGLEDVAALSEQTGWPVKVWGFMQDPEYWRRVLADHPGSRLEYCGFLSTAELQEAIGGCTALVMTPKWVEAFGLVAVEAMATGVPVVAYDRGGPAEIVVDGETGFVVPADDVEALAEALGRVDAIDRLRCRQRVDEEYSTEAFAHRFEAWLLDVVGATR